MVELAFYGTVVTFLIILIICGFCHGQHTSQYVVTEFVENDSGIKAKLVLKNGTKGPFGGDIERLDLVVEYETKERMRMTIRDADQQRWEVPIDILAGKKERMEGKFDRDYEIQVNHDPFSFVVSRKSDKIVIFDTTDMEFVYEDQYILLQNKFDDYKPRIYGFAQRFDAFQLGTQGHRYTLWNKDNYLAYDQNLYGSHPFYIQHKPEAKGTASGVLLFNSNAMDVFLYDKYMEYKVIGGIIDLYFFVGPEPESVVKQYHELIGKPHFPPLWSLGYHQCRYGYKSVDETWDVVRKYRSYRIPLDTIWNDIDYMDKFKLFTLDPVNYPLEKMQEFVNDLHIFHQHYVLIIDPGVKIESNYDVYEEGLKDKVYIYQNDSQTPLTNKVWPGFVNFPDFTRPVTKSFWKKFMSNFMNIVKVSGWWTDMNEVAGFCTGECHPNATQFTTTESSSENSINNPPYVPGGIPLDEKTIRLDAVQDLGIQYNTHNLYGYYENKVTKEVLEEKKPVRSFQLTRSTFVGSGAITSMWLGDNESTWKQLRLAFSGILTMNIMGVAHVGADICGFEGETNEQLCKRWLAIGAWYPFARNHNFLSSRGQEPWLLNMVDMTRTHLLNRYSLLPYFYTLFWKANTEGGQIWKPLFQLFPTDLNAADIEFQVMIGDAIMLTPVVYENTDKVDVYFPQGRWYNYYSFKEQDKTHDTFTVGVNDTLAFYHGGNIVIKQKPDVTTWRQAPNPYTIVCALDHEGEANGELFIDNGETFLTEKKYTTIDYSVSKDTLTVNPTYKGFEVSNQYQKLLVLGVSKTVTSVKVNSQSAHFEQENNVLFVDLIEFGLIVDDSIVIEWK